MTLIKFTIVIWLAAMDVLQCKNVDSVAEVVILNKISNDKDSLAPAKLFIKSDADRIMGEPTHLDDSSSKMEALASSYLCSFKADVKDVNTGKTGAIYFLFERYKDIAGAKVKYSNIHEANKPHGIEDISNLGDEAYYHTDEKNFYFIMVRKGKYVFNMKVNKRTSTTSLTEFRQTASRIAASI